MTDNEREKQDENSGSEVDTSLREAFAKMDEVFIAGCEEDYKKMGEAYQKNINRVVGW